MTDRAHLNRVITDAQGNVNISPLTVSVYLPGTTTLLSAPLYVENTGVTARTNPFTISTGIVDFYLTTPQRVDLKVDDGTRATLYSNLDVLEVLPSSLQARTTATVTSASLGSTVMQQTTITIAKGFRLLHIQTDRAARVRLYATAAGQAADANRTVNNDPAVGVGLILDYVTTSTARDEDLSPLVDGASMEVSPSATIPITITNLSGSTSTVTVTLTYIQTE
jgi:hypothetical protein